MTLSNGPVPHGSHRVGSKKVKREHISQPHSLWRESGDVLHAVGVSPIVRAGGGGRDNGHERRGDQSQKGKAMATNAALCLKFEVQRMAG